MNSSGLLGCEKSESCVVWCIHAVNICENLHTFLRDKLRQFFQSFYPNPAFFNLYVDVSCQWFALVCFCVHAVTKRQREQLRSSTVLVLNVLEKNSKKSLQNYCCSIMKIINALRCEYFSVLPKYVLNVGCDQFKPVVRCRLFVSLWAFQYATSSVWTRSVWRRWLGRFDEVRLD
jgi:hypothetical protein